MNPSEANLTAGTQAPEIATPPRSKQRDQMLSSAVFGSMLFGLGAGIGEVFQHSQNAYFSTDSPFLKQQLSDVFGAAQVASWLYVYLGVISNDPTPKYKNTAMIASVAFSLATLGCKEIPQIATQGYADYAAYLLGAVGVFAGFNLAYQLIDNAIENTRNQQ